MRHFFTMGGYAVYVWSAYGIAGVMITGKAIAAKKYFTTIKRKIQHAR